MQMAMKTVPNKITYHFNAKYCHLIALYRILSHSISINKIMPNNGIKWHYFALFRIPILLSKKRETNFVNSHSFAFLRDLFIEILSLNVIISHYNRILSHSTKKLSGWDVLTYPFQFIFPSKFSSELTLLSYVNANNI